MNFMKIFFEMIYGVENVEYNKEESSFLIKVKKNLYVIVFLKF